MLTNDHMPNQLVKVELNDKVESKYIKHIGESIRQQIMEEITQELFKDILFETPEDAANIIKRNTSFDKIECRQEPWGVTSFTLHGKAKPMPTTKNSSYAQARVNTLSQYNLKGLVQAGVDMAYDSTSSSSLTSYNPNYHNSTASTQPINFKCSSAIDTSLFVQALSKIKIEDGQEIEIELPDNSVLKVATNGSYQVIDDNAQVQYKANRIRGFNRYINSSDLLQDFIRFLGELGVRQSQVLEIPIELFINWLVCKAAEQDGEEAPDDITAPENHPKLLEAKENHYHKCLCCGRFINNSFAEKGFNFCNGNCASNFAENKLAVA